MELEFLEHRKKNADLGFPSDDTWVGSHITTSYGESAESPNVWSLTDIEEFRAMVLVVPEHILQDALKRRSG